MAEFVHTTLEKVARVVLGGALSVERAGGSDGPLWKYVLQLTR